MAPVRTRLTRWLAACLMALGVWNHARAGDVEVALESFGAMRAFRPGDMTGVRVRLTSARAEPVECLVQWDLENVDGDLVSHTRPVTLAPKQPAQAWLYARLPASKDATLGGEVFTVRVFEARDGVRARELGSLRFGARDAEQPSQAVGMQEGLLVVIGGGRMGLEPMEATVDGSEVPSMNEVTRLATGVRVNDLPDRWEGLLSAATIVWAAEAPQSLSPERAAALLQWIEFGGHLVIVLPQVGDPWQLRGGSHPLSALLPARGASRVDGLSLEALLPVLSKSRSLRQPGHRMPATLFDPAALGAGWRTLVSAPSGALPSGAGAGATGLVVQRLWGHGRVSIVGLDIDALHRQGVVVDGAPQADVFWNAVLGRRADAPTEADYRAWAEQKPRGSLALTGGAPFLAGDESLVTRAIGQVGRASVGVLTVIAFFVAYWLAAVPGTWLLLRKRGRLAWAWPAFAAVSLIAAPVALALNMVFGGAPTGVRHLTVADFTLPDAPNAGQSPAARVRANAWMSVALGGFGTSEVSLGSGGLLIDWGEERGRVRRFPDTARAERSIAEPGTLRAPARATTSDMQAWWLGTPAGWGRVAWQDESRPVGIEVFREGTERIRLRGAIRHSLPGPLRDVQLLHVMPYRFEARRWKRGPGSEIEPAPPLPPCPARMAALAEPWDGGALDLGAALYPKGPEPVTSLGEGSLVAEMTGLYRRPLDGWNLRGGLTVPVDAVEWRRRFGMLTLFQMLDTPVYRRDPSSSVSPEIVRVHRSIGRELDLSAWLTRPCVIVTGWLDEAACPVPVAVDGAEAGSSGSVLVRLVLPLDEPDRGAVVPMAGNAVR